MTFVRYCNPGNGLVACLAEKFGCPEEYIESLFVEHYDGKRGEAQYQGMLKIVKAMETRGHKPTDYCSKCEKEISGLT